MRVLSGSDTGRNAMRILMLAVNDPAGTAIAFAKALGTHTSHVCRVVTLETRYNHAWDADLHLPDLDEAGLAEVEHLLRASDVFHFHMTADEDTPFGPFFPRDHLAGKAVVHHHHGHPDFRAHPEKYREKYRARGRRNLLVSTPDLLRKLPEARWLPNLVPVNDPLYLPCAGPKAEPPARPVTIAHSPTRKDLKNTDELLASVAALQAEGAPVALEMLDACPHVFCLRRKRLAHLCFDHLQGYYGMSSLEALSQGVPVVSGLDDWNAGHIRERFGVERLPWVVSSPARLTGDLRELARDADRRRAVGAASRAFMETVWSDRAVAAQLAAFYDRLE